MKSSSKDADSELIDKKGATILNMPAVNHFEVQTALTRIMHELKKNGNKLSKAVIIRRTNLPDSLVTDALKLGHDKKYINWGDYNVIEWKNDFNIAEEDYYPIISKSLSDLWLEEKFQSNEFFAEITARRDSKISGRWTRPDITLIAYKKFAWTIGEEFDIVTFEIKRPQDCNTLAVFESLSHRSAATRSYVVFPINEDAWIKASRAQAERTIDECSRHGVGLIFVENIENNPTPKHKIKARRQEIDHEKCNDFLQAVMTDEGKSHIARWKR